MTKQLEQDNAYDLPGEEAGEDLVQFPAEEGPGSCRSVSATEKVEEELVQFSQEEVREICGLVSQEEESEEDLMQPPEAGPYSLFQRLSLQRDSYFADVEKVQDESVYRKRAGTVHLLRPSGFADLHAWCSAGSPTRSALAPIDESMNYLTSIVERPTLILPVLTLAQSRIADLPTRPALTVVGNGLSACGRRLRKLLTSLFRHLLPTLLDSLQRMGEPGMPWQSVPERYAWLMERRREYEQRSEAVSRPPLPSPDERYARYLHLHRDRSANSSSPSVDESR